MIRMLRSHYKLSLTLEYMCHLEEEDVNDFDSRNASPYDHLY